MDTNPGCVVNIVTWTEAKDLLARFQGTFAGDQGVRVSTRENICQHLGVTCPQDKEYNRIRVISSLCRKLGQEQQSTGQDQVLLVDELPPVCGPGGSMDWSSLDIGGIKVVLCLQPTIRTGGSASSTVVVPPATMAHVCLARVYRCSQRILAWLAFVVGKMKDKGNHQLSFNLSQATSGHEVVGERPDTLFLCHLLLPHSPDLPAVP